MRQTVYEPTQEPNKVLRHSQHTGEAVKHLTDTCQQPQGHLELGWALETSHGSSRAQPSAKDSAGSALAQGSSYFEKHHSFGSVFTGFGFFFCKHLS